MLVYLALIQYFIMLLPHSCRRVILVQITLLCICVNFSFRRECVFTVFIVIFCVFLSVLCLLFLWALLPDLKYMMMMNTTVKLYRGTERLLPGLISDLIREKAILREANRIKYTKQTKNYE